MVKEYVFPIFVLLMIPFFSCTSDRDTRRITAEEYLDKMKAGWIGQMAGVGWGGPTEFKWNGKIIPEEAMPE